MLSVYYVWILLVTPHHLSNHITILHRNRTVEKRIGNAVIAENTICDIGNLKTFKISYISSVRPSFYVSTNIQLNIYALWNA